jgi:peptidoglycan/LPS O-acetylase OafA/YrhL
VNLKVLDGLRGLTALYVALYHATGLLWHTPPQNDGPAWLFANAMSFGHQAVLLFFLISGFCIHYGQAKTGAHRINAAQFAWRRVKRLYPPLVLGLILTAGCDVIGAHLTPGLYGEASMFWQDSITVGSAYTPRTIVGNLLFQARLMAPELGSNSPLWSLAFEFWFYVLYPLMLAAFVRLGPFRTTVMVGAISALSWFLLGWLPWWHLRVLSDWGVWVAGALLAELYVHARRPGSLRVFGPLAAVALVAFAWLSPIGENHERIPDLWWGVALAAVLAYVLLAAPSRVVRAFENVCLGSRWLGTISYSLYLVHYPLLALLAAGWLAVRQTLPTGLELAAVGVAASIGLGWLAWLAVERHCVPTRAARSTTSRAQQPARRTTRNRFATGLMAWM